MSPFTATPTRVQTFRQLLTFFHFDERSLKPSVPLVTLPNSIYGFYQDSLCASSSCFVLPRIFQELHTIPTVPNDCHVERDDKHLTACGGCLYEEMVLPGSGRSRTIWATVCRREHSWDAYRSVSSSRKHFRCLKRLIGRGTPCIFN